MVGVAVGGSGVSVGGNVGTWPGGVAVGLSQAGGTVCVGKITAPGVTVGLKSAVIVKSGVGKVNGVGDAMKGKLHASAAIANNPTARSGKLFRFFIPTSLLPIIYD